LELLYFRIFFQIFQVSFKIHGSEFPDFVEKLQLPTDFLLVWNENIRHLDFQQFFRSALIMICLSKLARKNEDRLYGFSIAFPFLLL
jgi:hypothetical protein